MGDMPQMGATGVWSKNSAPSYDVRRTVRSSIVTPLLLVPIVARRKEFEHKGTKLTKIGIRGTFERVGRSEQSEMTNDQVRMTSLNRR